MIDRSVKGRRGILAAIGVLAFADAAVLVVRLRLVAYVTGSYIGQGCALLHPYDPAERTYLIILAVLSVALCAAVIAGLAMWDFTSLQKALLIVLLLAAVVVLGYAALVWTGGFELSNRPVPETDPCGGFDRP